MALAFIETTEGTRNRRLMAWVENGRARDARLGPRMTLVWAAATVLAAWIAWSL